VNDTKHDYNITVKVTETYKAPGSHAYIKSIIIGIFKSKLHAQTVQLCQQMSTFCFKKATLADAAREATYRIA